MKAIRRVLGRLLAGAVGVFMIYLTLANVALSSGAARMAIDQVKPSRFFVGWSSAYTLWFGRVHVEDLVLRGNDNAVQWRVTVEQGRLRLGIVDLVRKRVSIRDAYAKGVTVRVRRKLDPAEATRDYVAKLPSIVGLGDPPLRPAVMPPPPKHPITVDVDGLVVDDVREVWIDTLHFTDTLGHAEGGFVLEPTKHLRVGVTVDLQRTGLAIGRDAVVVTSHGHLALRVPGLDLHEVQRADALHALDAEIAAVGEMGDVRFLDPLLAPKGVRVAGGGGPAQIEAAILHGVLQPKTRFRGDMRPWVLTVKDEAFSIAGSHVHGEVDGALVTSVESAGVMARHGREVIARSDSASALVTLRDLDLGQRRLEAWAISLHAQQAESELTSWNGLLSKPLLRGGQARGVLHADVEPHHARLVGAVAFEHAAVLVDKAEAVGDGSAKATALVNLDTGEADVSGAQAEIHDVAVGKQRDFWATVTAKPLHIRLREGAWTAVLSGEARNGRAVLDTLGAPGILDIMAGDRPLAATATLHAEHAFVALERLDVKSTGVEVTGHYQTDGNDKAGHFLIALPLMNVGVNVTNRGLSTELFASR